MDTLKSPSSDTPDVGDKKCAEQSGITIGRGACAEQGGIALGNDAYAKEGQVVINGPFIITGSFVLRN